MTTATAETVPAADTKEPLILTGDGYGLTIAPAAVTARDAILKTAGLVVVVNDPVGDAAAEGEIKKLAEMRIGLEKARMAAKRPALDFGAKVDETAKVFIAQVVAEEERLKKLRSGHAQQVLLERQRLLREIAAAKAEEDRLRREAEAKAQQEAAAAEAARKEAERKAWEAETPEEEAAAQKAVEAAAAIPVAAAPVAPVATRAPVLIPQTPKGAKMVLDYEVTDLDAVYQANPNLVKMEIRHAETLAAIKALKTGDTLPELPGLRVFERAEIR